VKASRLPSTLSAHAINRRSTMSAARSNTRRLSKPPVDQLASLGELIERMQSGDVNVLIVLAETRCTTHGGIEVCRGLRTGRLPRPSLAVL